MRLIKDLFFTLAPKRLPEDRAVILMYHSISEADYFAAVSPRDFEAQMSYLAELKFPVLSLAELVRRIKASEPLGGAVAITFDDGYLDNYAVAYPLLKQYGFPATIFVTTGLAGQADKRGLRRMTAEQWKELESTGLVDIEPHTKTHPRLSRLPLDEAREEILGSKQAIEAVVGKRCQFFATPYGDFNEAVVGLIREAGFEAATTVSERTTAKAGTDLMRLPRVSIDSSTTMAQFKGKLSTAVDWYHAFKPWG